MKKILCLIFFILLVVAGYSWSSIYNQGTYNLYGLSNPTVYGQEGDDVTPPSVSSSFDPSVSVPGNRVVVQFTEDVVTSGYTSGDLNLDCNNAGSDISLTNPTGDRDVWYFAVEGATISEDDVCNLDFNGASNSIEDDNGNDMTSFSDQTVLVYSSDFVDYPVIAGTPYVDTATNITINFSKDVVTTGYTTGDFNLDCVSSGSNIALSTPAGAGSTWSFTIDGSVSSADSCTLDFNGAANSIEDTSGNDMAAVTGNAVTVYGGATPPDENYTEEHWVTQSGAGSQNGESAANAWSVANFNSSGNWSTADSDDGLIGPKDIVYFSGTITTSIAPPASGTSSGHITLDGYEAGYCDPISTECSAAAVITSNATAGTAQSDSVVGINLRGDDYFIIQDFRFKNHSMGLQLLENGSGDECQYIIIRRNYFYQCYRKALNIGYITYNDAVSTHITVGGAAAQGNYFLNNGYNREPWENAYNDPWAIQISCFHLVFSYNEATNSGYSDDGDFYWGANVIECQHINDDVTTNFGYVLFEHNILHDCGQETVLSLKEGGGYNAVIRYNEIYGAKGYLNVYDGENPSGHGITIGGSPQYDNHWHNVYVYGNRIHDVHYGTQLKNLAENLYVYANLYYDVYYNGILSIDTSGSTKGPTNCNIVNNTFYNCGVTRVVDTPPGKSSPVTHSVDSNGEMTALRTAMLTGAFKTRNNIFYNCRNGASSNYQIGYLANSYLSYLNLDYSTYYRSGTTDMYYYGASGKQALAWIQNNTSHCDHGENTDPGLTSPTSRTPAGFMPSTSTTNGASMAGDLQTITIIGGDSTVYTITPNMRYVMSPSSVFSQSDPDDINVIMLDNNSNLDRGAVLVQ